MLSSWESHKAKVLGQLGGNPRTAQRQPQLGCTQRTVDDIRGICAHRLLVRNLVLVPTDCFARFSASHVDVGVHSLRVHTYCKERANDSHDERQRSVRELATAAMPGCQAALCGCFSES